MLTRICRNRKKDTGRTAPLGLATSKVRRVKNVSASGAPSRCAERSSLEQGPAGTGVSAIADSVSERWRASGCNSVHSRPCSVGAGEARRAEVIAVPGWMSAPCCSGGCLPRSPHSRCSGGVGNLLVSPTNTQICSKTLLLAQRSRSASAPQLVTALQWLLW